MTRDFLIDEYTAMKLPIEQRKQLILDLKEVADKVQNIIDIDIRKIREYFAPYQGENEVSVPFEIVVHVKYPLQDIINMMNNTNEMVNQTIAANRTIACKR